MGKLAAGVVHDLRNLMVSLGYVESVLEQRKVAPDVMESVQVGMQGVGNLIHTLEAMHQFARGGTLNMEKATSALAGGERRPGDRPHGHGLPRAQGRGQRSRRVPPVNGDRQKLTQVLVNLVRNAVQATAQWRHIGVEASRKNGHVVFAVEDEGPGVPAELREHSSSRSSPARAKAGWGWVCTWPS